MAGYIGCAGLILIGLFLVFLFVWRKKVDNELTEFYKKSQLFGVQEIPPAISEAIGKGNWIKFKGSVVKEHIPYEFYWLESFSTSTSFVNNNAQTSINCFLVIAFPPNIVSPEFIKKAFELKETDSKSLDFFVLNTDKPIRVENLADGSFLMMWEVLNRAEVYQQKLNWLEANLS